MVGCHSRTGRDHLGDVKDALNIFVVATEEEGLANGLVDLDFIWRPLLGMGGPVAYFENRDGPRSFRQAFRRLFSILVLLSSRIVV